MNIISSLGLGSMSLKIIHAEYPFSYKFIKNTFLDLFSKQYYFWLKQFIINY